MNENYYDILGVSKGATEDEIKKAYRELAKQYHPDRNKTKGAESKFKKINEAYEVLSDSQKKQQYDMFGSGAGAGARAGAGANGYGQYGSEFDFGTAGFDFFKDIFGGSGFGASSNRGADIEDNITISFEDAYAGKPVKLQVRKQVQCGGCKGSGSKNGQSQVCPNCNGHRYVKYPLMGMYIEQVCGTCQGKGSIIKDPCDKCRGSGLEKKVVEIQIDIPAGIENNMTLRYPGYGNPGVGAAPSNNGDLLLKVYVKSSKNFERKQNDLYIKLDVSLEDLLMGKEKSITLPNQKEIKVKIEQGHSPNEEIRIPKLGFPQINSRNVGSLVIQLYLKLPKKLSDTQEKCFSEFMKSLNEKSSWW